MTANGGAADTGTALDGLPCGYVETDPNGLITAANPHFCRLVARTAEELLGRVTVQSLLAPGDRIYFDTHYRPALQMHGEIREIAFELVRPDDDRVPVLVSSATAADNPQLTRTVVFEARDRRLYEKELLRARRAAERAEAQARSLAQTLQQTFIPPSMPDVPGLELAGAYRPAGDGSQVGGDFYDVFQIGTGEWIVVVGDVCGKGVEAAVITSFVRHTLRALAVQWDDPSQILQALNTALLTHESDRFCTAVVIRLLRDDDRWLVSISSGGHPLPLLVGADGTVAEVGAPGSLIGVLAMPQLADERITLAPGDSLVIFTDGVTEARGDAGPFGVGGMLELVAGGVSSAAATTAKVLDTVLDFQAGTARDDIAVVAMIAREKAREGDDAATGRVHLDIEEKNRALRALEGLAALDD
ncbi:PP2C family protein-serine/threonine phosphatase [Aeromicrobium wangtongii]|uniref:SpoIIE family protein phosphatase n=1 Tax=Aeromicrobium wangtongii TaxID=2969247 RepID=A0ABY5M7Q3_9ACTN|nr:SpoIIE family protein phosphatase [Aeromicrobium wangtongii]MCD9199514.1 SpoIIE family protein phosphatase [Aeromicrobium wangtongii]UUP13867.1 SpoIIE family protein phosphatase [Aeromicrobium wangtongii]